MKAKLRMTLQDERSRSFAETPPMPQFVFDTSVTITQTVC